ncbi:hypothetical protein PYW07_008664 [Mythimna separata]|uniref:Uncharacterized protein n=1 Tax=Mythimna separata TaxID=271217 RepID=A0AAD8DP89_MYTSE|nr:hypothetical protein PYW07_008664 [Mythimna separata]
MKLRSVLIWTVVAVTALTVVESSILLKDSLVRPRLPDPCFSCRSEDRPFAYPLISYMSKIKDMFVRGLNTLVANAKKYKLK